MNENSGTILKLYVVLCCEKEIIKIMKNLNKNISKRKINIRPFKMICIFHQVKHAYFNEFFNVFQL